jgi:GNAT superfamily N-acetyltransferase
MIAVRRGCLEYDHLRADSIRDPLPTLDDLAQSFGETPGSAPALLIAEAAGEIVGFGFTSCWVEQSATFVAFHRFWLLPTWRASGAQEATLIWAEDRCRALAQGHGATKAEFATNVCEREREKLALMQAHGYQTPRQVVEMQLTAADTGAASFLPSGVETRPLAPEHYPALFALVGAAWAGLWGALPSDEAAYREFVAEHFQTPGFDPSLCEVAWHGDEAISWALGEVRAGGQCNVPEVATHPRWQGCGLASTLLRRLVTTMHERGLTNIWIVTDAENSRGARAIYERVGFRGVVTHHLMRKAMDQ